MSIIDIGAQSGLPPASESQSNKFLGFKGSLKTGIHRKIEKCPPSQTTRFYRVNQPIASPEIQELLYDYSKNLGNSELKSIHHPSLSFSHPLKIQRSRLVQPPESIRASQQKRPKTSVPRLNMKKSYPSDAEIISTRTFNFSRLQLGSMNFQPQSLTSRPQHNSDEENDETGSKTQRVYNHDNSILTTESQAQDDNENDVHNS